jgi:hypothetical protein
MKNSIALGFVFLFSFCKLQSQVIENRNVVFYFKEVAKLELQERIKQNLLIDSVTIAQPYRDSITNRLNEKGFHKNIEVKELVYNDYYKNYLYLQSVNYKNKNYALYFTMTGFYEIEFIVFRDTKKENDPLERILRTQLNDLESVLKLKWMYQEAPKKNIGDARIFIENDYLVFETGQLYLSAVDLKTLKPVYENENPYRRSSFYGKDDILNWVSTVMHPKIKTLISQKR